VKKEVIPKIEILASVDASKEQQVPSSDDVVMKEDIKTDEILASVDASKEQQGQLLIYVLYSAFNKLSKCAN
jgi:hypothetical protein